MGQSEVRCVVLFVFILLENENSEETSAGIKENTSAEKSSLRLPVCTGTNIDDSSFMEARFSTGTVGYFYQVPVPVVSVWKGVRWEVSHRD
jgi:hypothetical protein